MKCLLEKRDERFRLLQSVFAKVSDAEQDKCNTKAPLFCLCESERHEFFIASLLEMEISFWVLPQRMNSNI